MWIKSMSPQELKDNEYIALWCEFPLLHYNVEGSSHGYLLEPAYPIPWLGDPLDTIGRWPDVPWWFTFYEDTITTLDQLAAVLAETAWG